MASTRISRRGGPGAAALGLLLVALLGGCERADPTSEPQPAQGVVASLYGQDVTQAELDASLRLWLHDLEWTRYERRLERLREILIGRVLAPRAAAEGLSLDDYLSARAGDDRDAFVTRALAAARVQILLEEPVPPRLEVGAGDDAIRGDPDAPVTIVVFSDFQSSHSRRLQPTLRRILESHAGRVRVVVRDFPLGFHPEAVLAAEAAECAGEQGAYWRYHDALFEHPGDLGRSALDRRAAAVGLELDRFAGCLDARRFADEVRADTAEARRLGVTVAPTSFVNGLYLKGGRSYGDFSRWIDAELARLEGRPGPPGRDAAALAAEVALSDLPLTLLGTVTRSNPADSLAVIRGPDAGAGRILRPGDEVLAGVRLEAVEPGRASLRRDTGLEVLLMTAHRVEPLPEEAPPQTRRVVRAALPDADPEMREAESPPERSASPRPAPPAERQVRLRAEQVRQALGSPGVLEAQLENPDYDLSDLPRVDVARDLPAFPEALESVDASSPQRLVRIRAVPPGGLLEAMELRPGDVLALLDRRFVFNDGSRLWRALGSQPAISLVILRDGRPLSYRYSIE